MAQQSRAQRQAHSDSAASTRCVLRSRPFAPQSTSLSEPVQQLPELQNQVESTQKLGHSLKSFSLSPHQPSSVVQPKLTIGAPGDQYEREADRVAQQVVQRLNAPQASQQQAEPSVQREAMPEEEEEVQMKPLVQRQATGVTATPELETAIQQSRGGGQPLAEPIRHPLEQAFGNVDFSGVRVHTDAQADQLNRSIQAKAFTTGQDVFFRQGAYQPGSRGGQELLAHELTHVVQQNMSSMTQVQRKIGFEFEYENWRTAEASNAHFANETDTTAGFVNPNSLNWKKIPKGKALVRGNGFELQADDDPNNIAHSDLEVVTDPFDEGINGRGQIQTAMQGIQATLGAVQANFNNWWNAGHLPRATDLPGNAVRNRSFLYPTRPGFKAKPQVTIGLSLDVIAKVLEDVFVDPNETVVDAQDRLLGRQELSIDPTAGVGPIMATQGEAPSQARQAIASYIANNPTAPALSQELVGLLSLIVAYLRMADQGLVRSYAKTIAPLMARTDFGALFKMLSPQEQTWYKANKGQPFFDLVKSAPWLINMAVGDEVFSQGVNNPQLGVGQAQGLSRGKWIKGIARGTDYLTGKKFPDKNQREDIEGLGAYGKKTDTVSLPGGISKKAAILELRSMPKIDLANIDAVADRIWLYTYLANRGGNEKYGEITQGF